jgi:hypothetical protein
LVVAGGHAVSWCLGGSKQFHHKDTKAQRIGIAPLLRALSSLRYHSSCQENKLFQECNAEMLLDVSAISALSAVRI